MKYILIACSLLGAAAPAFAEQCLVKRSETGLESVTSANISEDGKTASKILLINGPVLSALKFGPDATGYSAKTAEPAAFRFYRHGASVAGKDWREPQSIGTTEGGFGIDWPRLFKDGKPFDMRVVIKIGGLGRLDKLAFEDRGDRDGVQLLLSDDFEAPVGLVVVGRGDDEKATAYTRATWLTVITPHSPVKVTLYDAKANLLVATATFNWPSPEAT